RAKKATCPLPEKCPLKAIWVRPIHDYRRFGYRVARKTEEWVNLYNHRTAIERVNSRLKCERRLDSHCFRGLDKVRFHCSLAVLSLLAGALVKAMRGELEEVRVCARRIA
ncbi:MAG: transposase, partial [Chloroflexi bacterium]|nr:transposase [Chloroflexota bacterium]